MTDPRLDANPKEAQENADAPSHKEPSPHSHSRRR